MSDIAISANRLGKRYRLGALLRQTSIRERLSDTLRAPFRWLRPNRDESHMGPREFWALRDVSFEMRNGDVVGLIGRNGAGKSTLLKILSRVTQPTEGNAEIHGRVGSLLEVGTGFHLELTGRENTYLNGAILGMGRREISRKFDEIVAFAEVADFIDTPLKHYSSGMQMRLAFAVAAHLEPETLLIDEVLAVGDMAFQKKCLGKMGEVASGGRSIVFVSHQLNQIRRLCKQAIWLDHGTIFQVGPTAEVAAAYETFMTNRTEASTRVKDAPEIHNGFVEWRIVDPLDEKSNTLKTLGPVKIKFVLRLDRPVDDGHHGIALFNHERQLMWARAENGLQLAPGVYEFYYDFSTLPLRPGLYRWDVSLFERGKEIDRWECAPAMIVDTEIHQHPHDSWNGVLNLPCQFSTERGALLAQDVHI